MEQQLGTQRLGHFVRLAVRIDFRTFKDTIRQAEFVEYGSHALTELDLREQSEVKVACQSGDAALGYPAVTVPKRKFSFWRSVTFPGKGASNRVLAQARVEVESLPHTMKRSSNCSMVMFLLKTGMIVVYI